MKKAFTLAEVLVTLGVIGVVAAMTIPVLAGAYKTYVRKAQFKKAYAAMEIAVQKTQHDLGEGVKCFYTDKTDLSARSLDDCLYFFSELMKNLQFTQVCDEEALAKGCLASTYDGENVYANLQGGDDHDAAQYYFANACRGFSNIYLEKKATVYVANSGFIIVPYTYYNGGQWQNPDAEEFGTPIFLMDVNGKKGPNKWGHDVMVFDFYKEKQFDTVFKLSPSNFCHALDVGGIYTKHFVELLYGRSSNY